MRANIERITPQRARELLNNNPKNRKFDRHHAAFLRQQMVTGKFLPTGEPIQITATGELLNGQHRLSAIEQSGTTQEIVVVYDVPEEAFKVMDQGRGRKAADIIELGGHANAAQAGAIAKAIIKWDKYGQVDPAGELGQKKADFTPQAQLEWLSQHDVSSLVSFGTAAYNKGRFLTRSEWALLAYIFGNKNLEDANDFLLALSTGADLPENSNILYVRNRLVSLMDGTHRVNRQYKFCLIFKLWNLYRRRITTGIVRMGGDLTLPELL